MRSGTRHRFLQTAFAALAVAAAAFLFPFDSEWSPIACFFLIVAALTLFTTWWCITPRSPYQAPDVLGERFGEQMYLETDGLCFLCRFSVEQAMCWLHVCYQNRFSGPCQATIEVIPMEGISRRHGESHEVPPIATTFRCDGGEVGVYSHPFPIAKKWQGRIMIFDAYANVRFPLGRGEMVRAERGEARVGGLGNDAARAALTAALLLTGHIHVSEPRSGKIEVRLPEDVAEVVPDGAAMRHEIFWRMLVEAEEMH